MLDFQEDFYETLGVESAAAPEDIRRAYLKLAKRLHPDRFPNDDERRAEAQSEFSKVTRAHDVLSDAKQREEYDAIRALAKSKQAIDSGEPPSQTASTGAPEQRFDSRETWAVKHSTRASEMLARKRFPEAETAIKEAIRLCPSKAIYYATLAEIHLARGWKTLAMTAVQSALKIDPKCAEAKTAELKIKASTKATGSQTRTGSDARKDDAPVVKKGFLDQLKNLLNKKM